MKKRIIYLTILIVTTQLFSCQNTGVRFSEIEERKIDNQTLVYYKNRLFDGTYFEEYRNNKLKYEIIWHRFDTYIKNSSID